MRPEAVERRFERAVDPAVVAELSRRFEDFGRAYREDGLRVDDFDRFPPTRRTLRAFIQSYQELLGVVRDLVLPNPDLR